MDNEIFNNCDAVMFFKQNIEIFYNKLLENLPEFKKDILKSFKYYKNEDINAYIEKIIKNIEPHIKFISQYDEGIFSNDYSKKELKFIPGINFTKIYRFINDNIGDNENNYSEEAAINTKKTIFTFLQSIYLSGQIALSKINNYNEVLNKQKDFFKSMFNNLNLDEKIKEKLQELEGKEDTEDTGNTNKKGKLNGIFELLKKLQELYTSGVFNETFGDLLKDIEPLLNISKDIMKEINEDNKNTDNISNNFKTKIQKIIKSFIVKLKQKIASGEITKDKFEANIKKSINKIRQVIPNFDEIIKSFGFNMNFDEDTDTDKNTDGDRDENVNEDNKNNLNIDPEKFINTSKNIFEQFNGENSHIFETFKENFTNVYETMNNDENISELFGELMTTVEETNEETVKETNID